MYVVTICFDQLVRIWKVDDMYDPIEDMDTIKHIKPMWSCSILAKPIKTVQALHDPWDTEHLGDEILKVVLKPKDDNGKGHETVVQKVHPNCLTFSDSSRLFVGDSEGTINCWDVSLRHNNLVTENHFKILHKELEGD